MIYCITGGTGTGKSTWTIKNIVLPAWKKGRTIYTNIVLLFYLLNCYSFTSNIIHKIFKTKRLQGKIFLFNSIYEILDVTDAMIFFDDAGVMFNGKNWESIPMEFVYKLMLQRHDRLDLVATVPRIKTLHIDFRRLVHKWYHLTMLLTLGKEENPKKLLIISKVQQMDIDYIDKDDPLQSMPALNFLGNRKSSKLFFITYFTKKYFDTHAKINFKRYKTIWLSNNLKIQAWIIPIEISLRDGLKLFSSLNYQLNRKK